MKILRRQGKKEGEEGKERERESDPESLIYPGLAARRPDLGLAVRGDSCGGTSPKFDAVLERDFDVAISCGILR